MRLVGLEKTGKGIDLSIFRVGHVAYMPQIYHLSILN